MSGTREGNFSKGAESKIQVPCLCSGEQSQGDFLWVVPRKARAIPVIFFPLLTITGKGGQPKVLAMCMTV